MRLYFIMMDGFGDDASLPVGCAGNDRERNEAFEKKITVLLLVRVILDGDDPEGGVAHRQEGWKIRRRRKENKGVCKCDFSCYYVGVCVCFAASHCIIILVFFLVFCA